MSGCHSPTARSDRQCTCGGLCEPCRQADRYLYMLLISSLMEAHSGYCRGEKSWVISLSEEMASNHRYLLKIRWPSLGMVWLRRSSFCFPHFSHCTFLLPTTFLPFYNMPNFSFIPPSIQMSANVRPGHQFALCLSRPTGPNVRGQQFRRSVPGNLAAIEKHGCWVSNNMVPSLLGQNQMDIVQNNIKRQGPLSAKWILHGNTHTHTHLVSTLVNTHFS